MLVTMTSPSRSSQVPGDGAQPEAPDQAGLYWSGQPQQPQPDDGGMAAVQHPYGYNHVAATYAQPGPSQPPYAQPGAAQVGYGQVPPAYPSPTQGSPAQVPPTQGPPLAYGAPPTGYGTPGIPAGPGAGGQMPPQTSPRQRKRRVGVIVGLVVVLVLTVGGVVGAFLLRNRVAQEGSNAGGWWSSAWIDGHEEAWSLDPPSGAGRDVSVDTVDGRLIRSLSGSSTTTVSVFNLESGSPELMWEKEISTSLDRTTTWKNWIIAGDTVLDIETGKPTPAPWPADATVSASRRGAVACVETTCAMWTSLTEKQWETTLPGSGTATVAQGTRVKGYAQAYVSGQGETNYLIVDLSTGSSKAIDTQESSLPPEPLADGWLVHNNAPAGSQDPDTMSAYEPDGTPIETYAMDLSKEVDAYPWSHSPFTLGEARKWFRDQDASWAPATYSIDEQDTSCESITVHGRRVTLGPDNSVVSTDDGTCRWTSPIQALYHSGDGPIATFMTVQGEETSLRLVEMDTGRASDPIALGDYKGYIRQETLLISYTEDGTVTAYRPTGS